MRSVKIGLAAALFLLASSVPALARLDPTPNATVLDQAGKTVQLSGVLASGTTFVVFYRGHW